ncbi:hypothetical protein J4437_05750 [Candidatus Woesearchaeota archaeon]|nr:hypothetical protein [Candidatus Woesearchaeota archaeon]
MVLTAKPFQRAKLSVISGPVRSGKTEEIEVYLDSLVDSGFKTGNNVLVVRHPDDDIDPGHIGRHEVTVTDDVDEIYSRISPKTSTLIVVGGAHFEDSSLIDLLDASVRSNINTVVSGLNLDINGKPYRLMPRLMALADEVQLSKAICSKATCHDSEANRSIKISSSTKQNRTYLPICAHHYNFPSSPPISQANGGNLEIVTGPMYSSKSTHLLRKLAKLSEAGLDTAVFKWSGDLRYGEEEKKAYDQGNITLHNGKRVPAVLVNSVEDIKNYLLEREEIRNIALDEGQFFPNVTYFCEEMLSKGYKITVTELARGFNRQPFLEAPALMCLADSIRIAYANCGVCHSPATESQRMKKIGDKVVAAHINDPLTAVGGKDTGKVSYFYTPRCLDHWVLMGEKVNKYRLPKLR